VYSLGDGYESDRPSLPHTPRISAWRRFGSGNDSTHILNCVAPLGITASNVSEFFLLRRWDRGRTPHDNPRPGFAEFWQRFQNPQFLTCMSIIRRCDRVETFLNTTVVLPPALLLQTVTRKGPRSGLKLKIVQAATNPSVRSSNQPETLPQPAFTDAHRKSKIVIGKLHWNFELPLSLVLGHWSLRRCS